MATELFVGIEGGGSWTRGVLVTKAGEVIACKETESSVDHWQVGVSKMARTIAMLIGDLKAHPKASDRPVKSVGLAIGGMDTEDCIASALAVLKSELSGLSENVYLDCDHIGPLSLLINKEGGVLIAGTGSMLVLTDGTGWIGRVGGWDHLIGDEGSAFWVSLQTVKASLKKAEGLPWHERSLDTSLVDQLIMQHFSVSNIEELRPFVHGDKFDKAHFAKLCKLMAAEMSTRADALISDIFYQAGLLLSMHVTALNSRIGGFINKELNIMCVGSVWKSWSLLQAGFEAGLRKRPPKCSVLILRTLKDEWSGSIGAAIFGAESSGIKININKCNQQGILHKYNFN